MRLATLKVGGRDGALVSVSHDFKWAMRSEVAPTLQAALDDWPRCQALLNVESSSLVLPATLGNLPDDAAKAAELPAYFPFDPAACAAPLPRAYQWADGSAYVNHVELVRKARGAEMPESFWTDPLMYQGGSDALLGPCDPILMADEGWGIDFEAEVAVVTDDVPMGIAAEDAGAHIVLIMLVNDVSLRNLVPGELAKGFGFFQAKPSTAFAPAAVTPEELGKAWDGGKVNLPLVSTLNGEVFGRPEAGEDMTFDFPVLIAHAARTRPLSAGTIIGSGTVSNRDRARGSSCIAERRMLETLEHGEPKTPFLRFGDRIRIEMFDRQGASIFGAIDQQVQQYQAPDRPGGPAAQRRLSA